ITIDQKANLMKNVNGGPEKENADQDGKMLKPHVDDERRDRKCPNRIKGMKFPKPFFQKGVAERRKKMGSADQNGDSQIDRGNRKPKTVLDQKRERNKDRATDQED